MSTKSQPTQKRKQKAVLAQVVDALRTRGSSYRYLVKSVSEAQNLRHIYSLLTHCVSLVDSNLHSDLINAMFGFSWSADTETIKVFVNFLTHLISANPDQFLSPVFGFYFSSFCLPEVPLTKIDFKSQLPDFARIVHSGIKKVLQVNPTGIFQLTSTLLQNLPHPVWSLQRQVLYAQNMFAILEYCPVIKEQIIESLVSMITNLDSSYQVSSSDETSQNYAEKEDALINLMFSYTFSLSEKDRDHYWRILLKIFDKSIIFTKNSKYTQYLLFYCCSFNPKYVDNFLDYLCNKSFNEKIPNQIRQQAVTYLGAFVGRAAFVSYPTVKQVVRLLCEWINRYLDLHEGSKPDFAKHTMFYYVCQATFYLVLYKYSMLSGNEHFFEFCSFDRILQSSLKPLKLCDQETAKGFSQLPEIDAFRIYKQPLYQRQPFFERTPIAIPFHSYELDTSSKFVEAIYQSSLEEDFNAIKLEDFAFDEKDESENEFMMEFEDE
eukprot:TRINITY_DN995_c0_g1_i1.p1 TRINITY_DN995_c0_g1~~TRINITY_DN995_c0_g1_i1.p1  ORF type:complete len:538 (-),score=73.65 TRINITY_DN995_c0_g1_i1:98-1570(-)